MNDIYIVSTNSDVILLTHDKNDAIEYAKHIWVQLYVDLNVKGLFGHKIDDFHLDELDLYKDNIIFHKKFLNFDVKAYKYLSPLKNMYYNNLSTIKSTMVSLINPDNINKFDKLNKKKIESLLQKADGLNLSLRKNIELLELSYDEIFNLFKESEKIYKFQIYKEQKLKEEKEKLPVSDVISITEQDLQDFKNLLIKKLKEYNSKQIENTNETTNKNIDETSKQIEN